MSDNEYCDVGYNASLGELRKQRGSYKGRLTLFEKYITKLENIIMSEKLQAELILRIESVSLLFSTFTKVQDKIELLLDEDELLAELEYRETFENKYFEIMSSAKCLVDVTKIKVDKDTSLCSHSHLDSISVKLPEIKLPSFDGSYDQWLEYKNSYLSMIHKRKDLDAVQKFHYLKSSLSGSALQVISALEFTAVNYTHAWELLECRYQNNRLLINNHVKSLFTAQSISKESPAQIRRLIDSVLRNLRALKSLDEPTDSWDTLLIYIITSKLDTDTEREWEVYKGSISTDTHKVKIKLDNMLTFLRNRADMLDMMHRNNSRTYKPNNNSFENRRQKHREQTAPIQQSHSFVSARNRSEKSTRICIGCGGNHALYTCIHFLNLSVQERIKLIDDKKLCRNCLRAGHLLSECMFGPCKQCQSKHNSLLHINNSVNMNAPANSLTSAHNSQSVDNKPVSIVSCAVNSVDLANRSLSDNELSGTSQQVLLCTALIEVMGNNNRYVTAKMLLDSGSDSCLISERLCKRLNVSMLQSTIRISGVGQSVSQSNKTCTINIRSKNNNFSTQLRCFVLPRITSNLPSSPLGDILDIPSNICLADPTYNIPSEIDLLLGADVFWDLLDEDRIRLPNGPYLQKSKVGWLISGPIFNQNSPVHKTFNCNLVQTVNIDSQLKRFWELEEVGKSCSILTEEDRICEASFLSTTTRDSSGRFSVRIPLKESADTLGDSYEMAKSRFLALERKLNRSPIFKKMYCDFMREYVDLGHMVRVDDYESPYYFLPHHGVLRNQSTTTKLRVVFDGSATTSSNKSLNDIQLIGPPLHNDIFSILLRFRQYKYVACADVEKMYRQILVHHDQRNLQLIFWRENSSDELGIYQLQTVTYGTASAPYLSMRCLRQLAQDTNDEVIAQIINEDFFVDDLITGADDPLVLSEICEKTTRVLKSACFPLRKWTFNHDVSENTSRELGIGEHCQNKTLGLSWQVGSDELHFTTKLETKKKVTKRIIMSIISQIYDPLGLLSPTIIIAKIMLQKLWLSKIDWDQPVPHEIECMWGQFLETLSYLGSVRVSRYVMSESTQIRELHIFTDASQDAYGACAYIRTCSEGSSVTTKLLCAKSKVAPVKSISIPRLELCGCLLGARLYHKIINSLRVTFTKVLFWTDSTIVMGWIRMSPHKLKTFVQNRVSQINELTGDAIWLHINGRDNPADIVSRGLALNELIHSDTWWHGPVFLRERELTYLSDFYINENELPEIKPNNVSAICTKVNYENGLIDFNRFSSFNRLRRAAAYVLRFIGNIRASKQDRKTGSLSVEELDASTMMLVRRAQQESFRDEINDLSKQSVVKSKRIIGLNAFIDDYKIIRVGGRLNNSPHFDNNKKHPILLCGKHRFTLLLFRWEHKQLLHCGPQLLLASVRDTCWPLSGRTLARKVVRDCVLCTRMKGKTLRPLMGDLPAQRLEPGFAFMRCGVDYLGPVMVLNRRGRGAGLMKGYDKWDRGGGGGGGGAGGTWPGREARDGHDARAAEPREARDRERDRDRERERQARAHQMSHARAAEPDASSLFPAPFRVSGDKDRVSQQLHLKLGDYKLAQTLIEDPSKSIGICAEPASPAPCHPSRRENEFKKPAHALNGRVHHRPYPYNKSEGLSSTGTSAHRPPPLRLPNGVQSQNTIDSSQPPIESILKEMKSLPTPVSGIAATPRKELENKFIFNHFTNRVQENPQIASNDLKQPITKPGLDNRISNSRSSVSPDVVNNLRLSESDDEVAATTTRLEPILSPIGSGGSPSSASESSPSDSESESSSAESSGGAAPPSAPTPPTTQPTVPPCLSSWGLRNFVPPAAHPPDHADLSNVLADAKEKPSPISELSDSEASSPSPGARRRRSQANRVMSAASSDEEAPRPAPVRTQPSPTVSAAVPYGSQSTGVKRGRPPKSRTSEEKPPKKKRGRPPKTRPPSPAPDSEPEPDPPQHHSLQDKTHIFRKVFTPSKGNEGGGKGGKGGKGKGGKGKRQVTIIEATAPELGADDDDRRLRDRSAERRNEEAIARVSPPQEPETLTRKREAERMANERIQERVSIERPDRRRSVERIPDRMLDRTDRLPERQSSDRLPPDRLSNDRLQDRLSNDRTSSDRLSDRSSFSSSDRSSDRKSNDRLSGDKMLLERIQSDKISIERIPSEKHDRLSSDKLSHDRLSSDKMSHDRLSSDKLSHDRLSGDKLSHDRLSSDKSSHDRSSSDKLTHERLMMDKHSHDRLLIDKVSHERLSSDKIGHDRLSNEKIGHDRLSNEKIGHDRLSNEKIGHDRLSSEKLGHERISNEKLGHERIANEKLGHERLSSEKIGHERISSDKLSIDRLSGDKLPLDRVERIAPERAEADVGFVATLSNGSERVSRGRASYPVRILLSRLRPDTVRSLQRPARRPKPPPPTPPTPPIDHSMEGSGSALASLDRAEREGRAPIYYSYFERLPADALSDEERDHKYYLTEAKRVRTAAEREQEPLPRVMLYLESVLCFVLTGRVLELEMDTKRAFTIYRETIEYIKSIHSMPQRFRASPHSTFSKLDILSLRVQALLYLRMFKMYNREVKEYNKIVQEYQQKPACAEAIAGSTASASSARSASPMSPSPSPAGSVGSGSVGSGSGSSGYCSLPAPGAAPPTFNGPSYCTMAHAVPAHAHNALLQLTKYYTFLYVAHDLWEQADCLCRLRPNQDLFIAVDRKCGPLTLFSTFRHLVQYVRHAISLLKNAPRE